MYNDDDVYFDHFITSLGEGEDLVASPSFTIIVYNV